MIFLSSLSYIQPFVSLTSLVPLLIIEVLPGVFGNMGIRPFISGEQGNKSLKLKGTGEKGNFREHGT